MQLLKLLLFSLPATIYAAPAATNTVFTTSVVTTVSTITSTQTTTAQPSTIFITSTFTSGTTTVTSTVATVTSTATPVTTSVCPGRSASGQALSKRNNAASTLDTCPPASTVTVTATPGTSTTSSISVTGPASTTTSTITSTTTVFTTTTVTSTVQPTTTATFTRSTGVPATTTTGVTSTTTQTPVVSVTACPTPTSCGNQGVQWAYYSNPFGNNTDLPNYSAFDPTYFKTQNPNLVGNTINVGFQYPGSDSTEKFYGSSTPENETYYALDHRGYIYAEYTGTYTFSVGGVDDIFFIWTSATASSGWNRQNAFLTVGYTSSGPGSGSASMSLTAGTYTAVRFMLGNGQFGSGFSLTITDPNGNNILSSSTSNVGYVIQYSCDGTSAPQYPQFGKET